MKNIFKKPSVQEIHNEIDTAQDRLLQQAKEIIAGTDQTDVKLADRLAAVGFVQAPVVERRKKQKSILVATEDQARLIEHYKFTYPYLKFITEPELDRICKKYGLVYMPVQNYAKDVPEKNLREIENAKQRMAADAPENKKWCELRRDDRFWLVSGSGGKWCGIWDKEWYRIPKRIDNMHFHTDFEADEYLHSIGFKTKYLVDGVKNFEQDRQVLFIAAPASHFKGQNKSISWLEPKDPIVFRYVKGGIQVLTKWGLEAEDETLVNEILN